MKQDWCIGNNVIGLAVSDSTNIRNPFVDNVGLLTNCRPNQAK